MNCRLCGAPSEAFGELRILHRHDIRYFRCTDCDFLQTETPYWLEEAYSSALSALDVGAVGRNKRFEVVVQAIIQEFFDANGTFVDYGGGHGLFVRLMRDRGFDFRWMDRFAENLFARGFEYQPGDKKADLLTAFEVFEHLEHPAEEIAGMLELADNLLFSTMLVPASLPKPGDWWYYVPESGQHIGLYSEKSLRKLAAKHHLHFATDGVGVHLLSREPVSATRFKWMSKMRVGNVVNRFRMRPSLMPSDVQMLKASQAV